VFVLTDNSVYPDGVTPTGIFTITQPDGLTRQGVFTSPDISGSTTASIALRLTAELLLQQGGYTIKYEVAADGYVPTTLSRSFTIAYKKATVVLTEMFDLFTPALEYRDDTVYSAGNFTQTIIRAWAAQVGTVGQVTGTSSELDLKYGISYYDAAYTISFAATVTYQSLAYNYLSIKDRLIKAVNTDAYTPLSSAQLLTSLTSLKTKLDGLINNCQQYDTVKADYEYAYILYAHVMKRICSGDKVNAETYIQEIINIVNGNVDIYPAHTNAPISPYVYDCGSTPAPTVPLVLDEVAGTAEAIAAGIEVGASTFTNSLIASKYVQVFRGNIWVSSKNPLNGNQFYTKTFLSDTITFSTPIQDTEEIAINTI
jgi:hypothetical protein